MRALSIVGVVLLVVALTSPATAQRSSLHVKMKGGFQTLIPLDEIKRITFSGLTGVGLEETRGGILPTFILLQNYPNPFNPSTAIQYELPRRGEVEVLVLNLSGQLVVAVDHGIREAGIHHVQWDGKNLLGTPVASGMYLCQVRFDNSVVSRKMMLLK